MITEIEDYFARGCGRCDRFDTGDCSTKKWAEGLAALRGICLEAGLDETVKWRHPCYMHSGRNIAIIGAFRGDYRLTFMNAALMTDPDSVLERRGPNTRHPDMIRFMDNSAVAERETVLRAYLSEAIGYAEAGLRAVRTEPELDMPEELVTALEADPDLAEAFDRLTPGRQRSYVINLNGARKPATRTARIARFRNHILAGKGASER